MHRGSFLIVFLLLFVQSWAISSQTLNQVGVNEGLSQSSANSIIQDYYGFLWIATNDGLNRFDSHTFKLFNVSDFCSEGFQSNTINCLVSFDTECIWFGTKSGVYCFNQASEKIKPFKIQASKNELRGIVNIKAIAKDPQSKQIFALSDNALYKLNTETNQFDSTQFSTKQPDRFTSLYIQTDGTLWIGARSGLYKLDKGSQTIKTITANLPNQFAVTSLWGTNDALYIGTRNGLYTYSNPGQISMVRNTENLIITSIHITPDDLLWLGTRENGVLVLDQKTQTPVTRYSAQQEQLIGTTIRTITHDRFNYIWLGTTDRGIVSIDTNEQFIKRIFDPQNTLKQVTAIAKTADDQYLISTATRGLQLVSSDSRNNILRSQAIPTDNRAFRNISSLVTIGDQHLAASENGGLILFSLKGNQIQIKKILGENQLFISDILVDQSGNILISANNDGVYRFDLASETLQKIDFSPETKSLSNGPAKKATDVLPSVMARGTKGTWFGNVSGGVGQIQLDGNGGQIYCFDNKILSSVVVSSLFEMDEKLWIGTLGKGLFSYNLKTDSLQHYGREQGLNNEVIHTIEADNNKQLWFATNRGLVRFNPKTNEFAGYSGTNYLQGFEFNDGAVFKSSTGELFFGGNNGVNYFNPKFTENTTSKPLIHISEVLVNNTVVKPGELINDRIVLKSSILETDHIDLYHGDNMISLVVSPIHFSDSRNNSYAYKLEKYDSDWIHRNADNRYITYHNLKGGTYTLRIKALSSDGQWSDEKQITIKVHPPLWEKTWFMVLVYLMAFSLVGLIFLIAYNNQKKKRGALEHEKSLLQSLMDNVPDTIYFKDLQSKFIRVNKAQAQLLRLKSPEEAIGKSDFDFFDHAEESYAEEQEIIKTGQPVINKMHQHEIDGKKRYMSDTKIALHDQNKNCIGTVGITRDMTVLIEAEEALKESQSKFKALFDNAPLAIFRVDQHQKIVESNVRFRKMFGLTSDEDQTDIGIEDILVDQEISMLIFETVLETREVNTEIMLKRRNGDTFIANMTLALLEEGFKEITIEGIIEDITQMVKARDEILKAKDDAEEANRLKSMFLANMSHEIRTPMNAIIGFTNMLREPSNSEEETNSFIDVIQSNGQSLMTLIDSIVDFSKLEADQMGISKSEFNLNALLETVCADAHKSLVANFKENIQLIKTIDEQTPCRIFTDRHRLNQVMNHLVSNAVKFTDDGEIEIGYQVVGNHVNIFVRDTGIGVAKTHHSKIFERFAKVNEDKNRLYGGTGIGLTISKGLIELMGGSITVESEINKGALFTVQIPIGLEDLA